MAPRLFLILRMTLKMSAVPRILVIIFVFLSVIAVVIMSLSHVRLFASPWTVVHQAPLSMGFSRQEYWSGLPIPHPGDLPDPPVQPMSPTSPALAGKFFTTELPGKSLSMTT